MKKIPVIIFAAIVTGLAADALLTETASSQDSYYVKIEDPQALHTFIQDNSLLVEPFLFYPHPSPRAKERFASYYVVTVPQEVNIGDPIERLGTLPGVELVERIQHAEIERGRHPRPSSSAWNSPDTFDDPYSPNDPLYPEQYHHRIIGTFWAWNVSTGEGVTVSIIDSGSQTDHPDLEPNLEEESDNGEGMAHGTWVAGIVGAKMDNNMGIAGVAGNCRILSINKVLGSAIVYAADHGAKVISMSITTTYSQTDEEAVEYAWEHGVFLCGSAGNSNEEMSLDKYPARYEHVMAVGGTDRHDQRWVDDDEVDGSNYGDGVDIYAPADSIFTTLNTDSLWPDYNVDEEYGLPYWPSGTSFSTPMVAGVAALLYSVHPQWTPQQVWIRLLATADTLSLDVGDVLRVNAARALDVTPGIEEDRADDAADWSVTSVGSEIVLRYEGRPEGFSAVIYDAAGRKVDRLHSPDQSGTLRWGEDYSPGVYFMREDAETGLSKKVVVID